MLTSILGLGGGGMGIANEYLELLSAIGAGVLGDPTEDDTKHGAWVFGRTTQMQADGPELSHGFSFCFIDSNSRELPIVRARLERMGVQYRRVPVYQAVDNRGFNGEWERAYTEIKRHQEDPLIWSGEVGGPPEPPGGTSTSGTQPQSPRKPLVPTLRDDYRLKWSELVLACTSMAGGSGRGAYKFLSEKWSEGHEVEDEPLFYDVAPKVMIGVLPPPSEKNDSVRFDTVDQFLSHIRMQMLQRKLTSAILADYNLAHAALSASADQRTSPELDKNRRELDAAMGDNRKADYRSAMNDIGQLIPSLPRSADTKEMADGGIVLATAPLLANGIGALVRSPNSPRIEYPKLWDENDLRNEIERSFVIPCYMEAPIMPGADYVESSLDPGYDDYLGYYGAEKTLLDDPFSYSIAALTYKAVSRGSLVPLPAHGVTPKEIGRIVDKALIVMWSDPRYRFAIDPALDSASDFLQSFYGIENSRGVRLEGVDMFSRYMSNRFGAISEPPFRLWVYLCMDANSEDTCLAPIEADWEMYR